MERAYYVVANVEPYREHQVVLLDDEREPDAGWVRSGWLQPIGGRRGQDQGPDRA